MCYDTGSFPFKSPYKKRFDYGNGVLTSDNMYTDQNYNSMPCELIQSTSADWQYCNYNSNTCVLTKVPYNNNFLNDLYYIVTAPFELAHMPYGDANTDKYYKPNIFSFNGHTYYNFFSNYAVELPN